MMAVRLGFLTHSSGVCYDLDTLVSGSNSVVECNLAKVDVAGSNPVSRSIFMSVGC